MITAGAVDENVARTEGRLNFECGSLERRAIENVAGDAPCDAAAARSISAASRSGFFTVAADNGELGAARRKAPCTWPSRGRRFRR